MTKFAIISDLHIYLSFNNKHNNYINFLYDNQEKIDVLFIAGDIISHSDDIPSMIELFDELEDMSFEVFFVLGNHEYYGIDIGDDSIYEKMIKKYQTIHLMNNKCLQFNDLNIIGTTLWTEAKFTSNAMLNDKYYVGNIYEKHDKIYKKNIKFINQNYDKNMKNVLLIHHGPHRNSIHEKYKNNSSNPYFTNTNISEDFISRFDYILHGHTHSYFNYSIGSCNVVCNPIGYENEETDYKLEILDL